VNADAANMPTTNTAQAAALDRNANSSPPDYRDASPGSYLRITRAG